MRALDGRFRFPKLLRLRRRSEFLAVQKGGKRRRGRYLVVIATRRGQGPTRMGVTASRKVGPAVIRNRIKRLIREAFRQHHHQLPPGLDLVVVAKWEAREATAEEIRRELVGMTRALGSRIGGPRPC